MKERRLTFNGVRYVISVNGHVCKLTDRTIPEQPQFVLEPVMDIEEARAVKAEAKRLQANRARRERDAALGDIGLVKVRGALGGTYWE